MNNQIYPCLWYNGKAKEAAELYCSAFKNAVITSENPMVVTWQMGGQRFMGLNGGPMFQPNPSISFYTVCETPEEVDRAWQILSDGGKVLMPLDNYPWSQKYGWLQDRYGVSWQLSLDKLENVGQYYSPLLMFTGENAGKARAALEFYLSIFPNPQLVGTAEYAAGEGDVEGYIKHAQFKLNDHVMMAMDSSMDHKFNFSEGISLVIECDTQDEIDYYWNRLTTGGEESQCGWLKDQFGVSWQVVPKILGELMSDQQRAPRVIEAFMKMKKFNIEALEKA